MHYFREGERRCAPTHDSEEGLIACAQLRMVPVATNTMRAVVSHVTQPVLELAIATTTQTAMRMPSKLTTCCARGTMSVKPTTTITPATALSVAMIAA